MYSNLATRVSSQPRCFKLFATPKAQFFPIGSLPKPLVKPCLVIVGVSSNGSSCRTYGTSLFVKPVSSSAKTIDISGGFRLKRSFSYSSTQKISGGSAVSRAGKRLPWLASSKANDGLTDKGNASRTSGSSWEESAKKLEAVSSKSSWEESAKRLDRGGVKNVKNGYSSWKVSVDSNAGEGGKFGVGSRGRGNKMVDVEDRQRDYVSDEKRFDENVEEEEEAVDEAVDDPRWNKIKGRFRRLDMRNRPEKPEFRRWNREEDWGRKTWKEATESTIPKMVGEGVYGVGPVLAALSAGRREFYVLYIQEGLDLSSNNRKKKDKKGFEKVMRMAEKIGLTIKEVSKHDLNMVVDNRPHQGLVLDASPLELVKIMELDPVSLEEDKNSLWVALDEVTDPQNLGAIIRSAYFFGASGVVLCAKNSAPLSGVVSKASAGSLELMELRYCKNMMQFLSSSAENGWRVLGGSVSSKAVPLNKVTPDLPTILVLGSEGTGLRPLVERSCTQLVRIPSNVPLDVVAREGEDDESEEKNSRCSATEFQSFLAVESLNVSVAAGVLLHHLIGNNYKDDTAVVDQPTDALG
ncbi:hypothetical protein UlMin_022147 [Ulmus minor]